MCLCTLCVLAHLGTEEGLAIGVQHRQRASIGLRTAEAGIVVDACRQGGVCLPLAFLRRRGVEHVDVFVLTHADLDHVDGAEEILEHLHPGRVVRFPIGDSLVALLARCLHDRPSDGRLRRLRRALDAIDAYDEANASVEASWCTRSVPVGEAALHLLAPVEADRRAARRAIHRLIDGAEASVRAGVRAWLKGECSRVPGSWNNGLSVALSVEWSEHRIVLAGDVEVPRSRNRGWRGVLQVLQEEHRLHLVRDARCVKVAHHGSARAFAREAWEHHASSGQVAAVLVAPWRRGSGLLPAVGTLDNLKEYAEVLVLTSEDEDISRRRHEAGWRSRTGRRGVGSAAVGIVVHRDPARPVEVFTSGSAGAWRARTRG